MTGKYWRAEVGVFLVLWLLGLGAGSDFIKDPGVFWHTVVGQRILDTGQLPDRDPFSCTFGGQPWVSSQFWLPEIGMALLHKIGGFDALVLATVTILAAFYAWVAYRIIQAGSHWFIAVLIVMVTVLASAYHFHPRPHLATFVLLGWTYACLQDYEADRLPLRGLFWLVPAFILWTNLHGGMLGGWATVCLAVAGWCLWRLVGRDSPATSWLTVATLIALLGLLALTALVNPAGWRAPATWVYLSRSEVLPTYIDEHKPLNPFAPGERQVLLLFGLYVVGLLGTLPRWPRVTWLLPLVWFVLALSRIRHGPLFSLTAALALAEILPQTRWARALAQVGSFLVHPRGCWPFRWTQLTLPLAAVGTVLGLQAAGVRAPLVGRGWAEPSPNYWPMALVPKLQELAKQQPGACIFNPMLLGGFLIYYAPDLRVFIDDRCELYPEGYLKAYFEAKPEDVGRWVEQYPIRFAIVPKDHTLDQYFQTANGWELLEETKEVRPTDYRLYRRMAGRPP